MARRSTPKPSKQGTSPLGPLAPAEAAEVLDRLHIAHPELNDEAERVAIDLLTAVSVDQIAAEVESALVWIPLDALAARAGRVRGHDDHPPPQQPETTPMSTDDWIEDLDEPDLDIDELIEQITVDAYGDEGYWSFRQAFEDHIDFPVSCSMVGTEVSITEIDFDDERRGLTAAVQRDGLTSTVSLLDLDIPAHHIRLTRLIHAYRRWLGLDR